MIPPSGKCILRSEESRPGPHHDNPQSNQKKGRLGFKNVSPSAEESLFKNIHCSVFKPLIATVNGQDEYKYIYVLIRKSCVAIK